MCYYYEKSDKPVEYSEGIAWIDPLDGSDPFPDIVTYRNGSWYGTGLDGVLESIEELGKVICIQKLEFPGKELVSTNKLCECGKEASIHLCNKCYRDF